MAYPRSEKFEKELLWLSDIAKALSHPARLSILEVLSRRDTCICGDIVDELPLAQATVSQHLKVLKEAGLITGAIEGPRTCYCLDRKILENASDRLNKWFNNFQNEIKSK